MPTNTYRQKLAKVEQANTKANQANAKLRTENQEAQRSVRAQLRDTESERHAQLAKVHAGELIDPATFGNTSTTIAMCREALAGLQHSAKGIKDASTDRHLADALAGLLQAQYGGMGVQVISTTADLRGNASLHPKDSGTLVVQQSGDTGYTEAGRMTTSKATAVWVYWLHSPLMVGLDADALAKAARADGWSLELHQVSGFNEPRESDGLYFDVYSAKVEIEPTEAPVLHFLPTQGSLAPEIPAALENYRRRLSEGMRTGLYRWSYPGLDVRLKDSSVSGETVISHASITGVAVLQRLTDQGVWSPISCDRTIVPALGAKLSANDFLGSLVSGVGVVTSASHVKVGQKVVKEWRGSGAVTHDLHVLQVDADVTTEARVSLDALAAAEDMSLDEYLEEAGELAELDA